MYVCTCVCVLEALFCNACMCTYMCICVCACARECMWMCMCVCVCMCVCHTCPIASCANIPYRSCFCFPRTHIHSNVPLTCLDRLIRHAEVGPHVYIKNLHANFHVSFVLILLVYTDPFGRCIDVCRQTYKSMWAQVDRLISLCGHKSECSFCLVFSQNSHSDWRVRVHRSIQST